MLVRIRNSHLLLVEMQNGTVTLKDSLEAFYKTKYTLTIQSSNCAPWYLPKLMFTQNLNMDVYNSFIHNCQTLETTKISLVNG